MKQKRRHNPLNIREHYYATGKHTARYEELGNGFYTEYNPHIKMYRLNHPLGVPRRHAGYTPHYTALKNQSRRLWE